MSSLQRTTLAVFVALVLTPACGGSESPPSAGPVTTNQPATGMPPSVVTPMTEMPVGGDGPGPAGPPAGPAVNPGGPVGPVSGPMPGPGPAPTNAMNPDAGMDDVSGPMGTTMPSPGPAVPTVPTLFWLDITTNRVMRSVGPDFSSSEAIVGRTNTAPDGIAVDVAGGKIYWSNMGSLLGTGGGTLQRANLDGSGVETTVRAGIARTPKQMQIDLENGHAYWCDREGAKVWRAGLDGASPETLVSGHGFQELVGVALDIPGRTFYFTDRIGRKILRASFDMPAGQSADTRSDIEELITFERGAMPIDLDVDLTNRMLYWTDRSLGTVNRAGMDLPAGESPGSRSDLETLVSGLTDTIGLSLDVENDKLYYTELAGRVHEAALDGSGARRVGSSSGATGVAIAHIPK